MCCYVASYMSGCMPWLCKLCKLHDKGAYVIIFFMSVGIFSTASEKFPPKHLSISYDYGKRLAVVG